MTSFPLHCSICPKAPDFSDLSHLLTHVGSKGHLSHYFKAQVRSRQDSSVRERLLAYDQWYQRNQVEKLLSQRMVLKENKNAQNRSKSSTKHQPVRTNNRGPNNSESSAYPLRFRKDEDFLDPQLSQEFTLSRLPSPVKLEPLPADSPLTNRAHVVPRMQSWSTANQDNTVSPEPKTPRSRHKITYTGLRPSDIPGSATDDEPQIVTPLRHIYPEPPALPRPQAFLAASKLHTAVHKHSIDRDDLAEIDSEQHEMEESEDKANECTKLKGICWPGMDIFDSASPDTRRKRNQKKDGSILAQMKANSAEVEPTELIFYSGGQLKKRRYISGQVESSPVKEETPKPKRQRIKAKRAPLRSMDSNIPRNGRRLEAARSTSHILGPQGKPADVFNEAQEPSQGQQHRHIRQETPLLDDDEVEWRLMLGELQNGKRRGFEVYEESPDKHRAIKQPRGKDRSLDDMYPFLQDKRSTLEILPASHGLPEQILQHEFMVPRMNMATQHELRAFHNENFGSYGLGASDQFPSTFFNNKENIQPIVDQSGRIDDTATHHNTLRNTQRYFMMDGNSHPQYYTSVPQHWGFMSAQPPQSFAYSPNPLSFSFGHPTQSSHFQNQFPASSSALPLHASYTDSTSNKSLTSAKVQEKDSDDETIDEEDETHRPMLLITENHY